MATKAGMELSPEEIEEYVAYGNRKITLPEKYEGVVVQNTSGRIVYRYPTEDETRAASAEAKASAESAEADEKMTARVVKEAQGRGVQLPPAPPAPEAPVVRDAVPSGR